MIVLIYSKEVEFAEFLCDYYVESKINETSNYNDSQPAFLTDEGNHKIFIHPKPVLLMSSNKKLRYKTVRNVLGLYHEPNQDKHPWKYLHHLLFTFYLLCNEGNHILSTSQS